MSSPGAKGTSTCTNFSPVRFTKFSSAASVTTTNISESCGFPYLGLTVSRPTDAMHMQTHRRCQSKMCEQLETSFDGCPEHQMRKPSKVNYSSLTCFLQDRYHCFFVPCRVHRSRRADYFERLWIQINRYRNRIVDATRFDLFGPLHYQTKPPSSWSKWSNHSSEINNFLSS